MNRFLPCEGLMYTSPTLVYLPGDQGHANMNEIYY